MSGPFSDEQFDQSGWSAYDVAAWAEIQRWKESQVRRAGRHLLPARARESIDRWKRTAAERVRTVQGSHEFLATVGRSVESLAVHGSKLALHSLDEQRVVDAYRRKGHAVRRLSDIRRLSLAEVEEVMPPLDLIYSSLAAIEGAAAGLVISGGEVATGVGVGPAAVVGAVGADLAVTLMGTVRAVGHIGLYYGYGVRDRRELTLALSMLGPVFAAESAVKVASFAEVSKAAQWLLPKLVTPKPGWFARQVAKLGVGITRAPAPLVIGRSDPVAVRLLAKVLTRFGYQASAKNLAKMLPLLGIVLGAGQNAYLLHRTADHARHLYREVFLVERYGVALPVETVALSEDVVPVTEIAQAIDAAGEVGDRVERH